MDAIVNGIPTTIFTYFDASLQKTFVIKTSNTQTGISEELNVFDGTFSSVNLKQYLSSSNFNQEITPVWNTMYAYTGTTPTMDVSGLFNIPSAVSAIHINKDTFHPVYIELQETPTSLTDRELNNSNRLISISDIGTTNVDVPDGIKIKFPEYFYQE